MSENAEVDQFRVRHLWQSDGWQTDVALAVGAGGRLAAATDAAATSLGAWVLPGMPNLHSHAFQRAMAGLAERKGRTQALMSDHRKGRQVAGSGSTSQATDDSFWSWRETMYAFAAAVGPGELKAVAAQLYVEMLKAGYTQVCEFHYLHHQPDGTPYAPAEAMSLALIEAAREAGIALTLLPVLYMSGGFDGRALGPRQRRFGHAVDDYLRLLETLRTYEAADLRVGIALHSLRAVPELAMRDVLASGLAEACPVHIHIAEQLGEVQDCLATRGARPVEWLLDHAEVDARWCLVHATHLTEAETAGLARSGAVVGLCPTTDGGVHASGWGDRHRLGFAHLDFTSGGAALAGIRATAEHASSQRGGARAGCQHGRNAVARGVAWRHASIRAADWGAAGGCPRRPDRAGRHLAVAGGTRRTLGAGQLYLRRQYAAGARRDGWWTLGGA